METESSSASDVPKCPICLTTLDKREYLEIEGCSHGFHRDCLVNWVTVSQTRICPFCRTGVISNQIVPNSTPHVRNRHRELDQQIDRVKEQIDDAQFYFVTLCVFFFSLALSAGLILFLLLVLIYQQKYPELYILAIVILGVFTLICWIIFCCFFQLVRDQIDDSTPINLFSLYRQLYNLQVERMEQT